MSGQLAAAPESPTYLTPRRFDVEKWKREYDARFPWLRRLQK
jgi:hypothetical protein